MARAQYWQLVARLRFLDENGNDIAEPFEIDTGNVATDMHRVTDHKVAEDYAAFTYLGTGAVSGAIQSPSIVLMYSPQNVRVALNVAAAAGVTGELTSAAHFDNHGIADGPSAPTANLVIIARTDGGDTGVDKVDLGNPGASAGNANDAFPVVMVSGQDT
jgi:hypothetical protein